jgi:glycosyltransferase involved in cell wall biosynthesis
MKISYCIPTKNNLRYLKGSIRSIKDNSLLKYEILVYIDADNDGTEEWLKKNAPEVRYTKNTSTECKGIAYGYNRCIEQATGDVICVFHADMYMGKGFDINLVKHIKPNVVVAATRIEPPLHPAGKEKIIMPFGMYPEDFDKKAFDEFVDSEKIKNGNVTTSGIFAPWMTYKNNITVIGMHDETLHSYYEDSDIFQRMMLNGCKVVQSWDALVYHFTCRGGQFQDGIEKQTSDTKFHEMRNRSGRYYIRKWGSWIKNDEYQHPIIPKKYNIGFVLTDVTSEDFLHFVEPWASNIFVDNMICAQRYMAKEQLSTNIDLRKRILNHGYIEEINNDILLYFSEKEFMKNGNENAAIIMKLSDILSEGVDDNSEFELGVFKMKTRNVKDITGKLIRV